MEKFFGTLIIVVILSFILGSTTFLTDHKKEYKVIEHYLYSFVLIAVIALVLWGLHIGVELLTK